MWSYLLPPEDERRLRPRPQTLHRWAGAIASHTRLQISVVLPPRTAACIHVQGRDHQGFAITPYTLTSTLQAPGKIKRKRNKVNKKVDQGTLDG
jgi:hypothetical protein